MSPPRPEVGGERRHHLQRPLLIKGEPGTGKTMLAEEVAAALGLPLLQWHIKSTTKAQQGLVRIRCGLAPARLAARRSARHDMRHYIVKRQAVAGLRVRAAVVC
jgi:DNA polymerase III delta prime subunit